MDIKVTLDANQQSTFDAFCEQQEISDEVGQEKLVAAGLSYFANFVKQQGKRKEQKLNADALSKLVAALAAKDTKSVESILSRYNVKLEDVFSTTANEPAAAAAVTAAATPAPPPARRR